MDIATEDRPSGIARACVGGALSVAGTFFWSLILTACFVAAGAAVDTTHWMYVLGQTANLVRSTTLSPAHFEWIFIVSIFISIFAQGTVTSYFHRNHLYERTLLAIMLSVKRTDEGMRLQWRHWRFIYFPVVTGLRVARTGRAGRGLHESVFVGALMTLLAAVSITFVNAKTFHIHLLTTLADLIVVAIIDLTYWLATQPAPDPFFVRGNTIHASALFRYFNRQLFTQIDSGLIVVAIVPIVRLVRALETAQASDSGSYLWSVLRSFSVDASEVEVAFFTGVASFYLVSTCILLFNLLKDFDDILRKKFVLDIDVLTESQAEHVVKVEAGDPPAAHHR